MKFGTVLALATTLWTAAASAQPQRPRPPPRTDLSHHDDEFSGSALDPKWTRFDQRYGWPDKLKRLDVGESVKGALHLEPYHGAWVRDLNAPFLFQTIAGDFDVRARVRVRGAAADFPAAPGRWAG